MQINPINFTGKVTVLNGAKKHAQKKDIEKIKEISNYEDVDLYIYSAQKNGNSRKYCAISPLGDTVNLRDFNFVSDSMMYQNVSDIKPAFMLQRPLCQKGKPQSLKIACDNDHGELIIGEKNSIFSIVFSKYDLNFRTGGYLGEKFTGTLFDKTENEGLAEFNFKDGKLCAKKTFNKNGELVKENEFKYGMDGSLTASLNEDGYDIFLPCTQEDSIFSVISKQLTNKE